MSSFSTVSILLCAICIFAASPLSLIAIFDTGALADKGVPDGGVQCLPPSPWQDGDVVSNLQTMLSVRRPGSALGHGTAVESHRSKDADSQAGIGGQLAKTRSVRLSQPARGVTHISSQDVRPWLIPFRGLRLAVAAGLSKASIRTTWLTPFTVVSVVIAITMLMVIAVSTAFLAIRMCDTSEEHGGKRKHVPAARSAAQSLAPPSQLFDLGRRLKDPGAKGDVDPENTGHEGPSTDTLTDDTLEAFETSSVLSAASSSGSSTSVLREDDPSCATVLWAFLVHLPILVLLSLAIFCTWFAQQLMVLPFRLCGGRPLVYVLHLFAPFMLCLMLSYVSIMHGESCYGRETQAFNTFDDFLQKLTASRRKNIKRNCAAGMKELHSCGIEVSFFPAGSWRLTPELCALMWHQNARCGERAYGYADIANCWKPVPSAFMFFGGMLVLLALPCDIQLFRTRSQELVSLNTRVHIGNVYLNPNYATVEAYAQKGIYQWATMDIMQEGIRLRASIVNFLPCMRSAKKALGLRSLGLADSLDASVSWSRSPRQDEPKKRTTSPSVPMGRKRAARKRAAMPSESS